VRPVWATQGDLIPKRRERKTALKKKVSCCWDRLATVTLVQVTHHPPPGPAHKNLPVEAFTATLSWMQCQQTMEDFC
jgi:hypothetical protein